jgi:hypothetical protein
MFLQFLEALQAKLAFDPRIRIARPIARRDAIDGLTVAQFAVASVAEIFDHRRLPFDFIVVGLSLWRALCSTGGRGLGAPVDITPASHPIIIAELFGARFYIVVRRTQTGEPIERRECLHHRALFATAFRNGNAVVDDFGRRDLAILKAGLAERTLLELYQPEPFPAPRRIWPLRHLATFRL